MKKRRSPAKKSTIFTRVARPFLLVLVVALGFYTVMTWGSMTAYLEDDAAAVFDQQVNGCTLLVQTALERPKIYLNQGLATVTERIREIVQEEGRDLGDISRDSELNQEILSGIMSDLLRILRNCNCTELYLILDGPSSGAEESEARAGIYLRNSNLMSYSSDNQDLMMERGSSRIAREWNLTLDTYWSAGFLIGENDSYFLTTTAAARTRSSGIAEDFGYWDYCHPVDDQDKGVLTYTLPILSSDGRVLGVLGMGMSEDHLLNIIDYKALGDDGTGAYVLANTSDGGGTYQAVMVSGYVTNGHDLLEETLRIRKKSRSALAYLTCGEDHGEGAFCAVAKPLGLYDTNTPYDAGRWILIGLRQEKYLREPVLSVMKRLLLMAAATLAVSLFLAYWASSRVAKPIRHLAEEVRGKDPNRAIRLEQVDIEEVDELTLAIETLSDEVAGAFTRISNIIQLSETGIAVYEYKEKENLVFCSNNLFEMMGWGHQEAGGFVDGSEFHRNMEELLGHRSQEDDSLLELPREDGELRWYRLNQREEGDSILGVMTDVTAEIREKKKIEYERDYDVLTNICNRRAFEEKMARRFEHPEIIKTASFIMWDLDNLKFVNDTYGHGAGDAYIIAIAHCLELEECANVISARRSGDEFVTFVYGMDSREQVQERVDRIWERVQQGRMFLTDGEEYRIRVSAGVANYPEDTQNYQSLSRYADFAMYTAKHNCKGRMVFFDASTYRQNRILLQGQEAFNNLLEKHLVRYALQPIISARSGSIYGYEMLMRSEIPDFKTPDEILKLARAQSMLYDVEIMTWMEAMNTFVRLADCHVLEPGSRVFINSISNQIIRNEVRTLFGDTYRHYLPRIVCEFTEEEDGSTEVTREKMDMIRSWNGMIAIDDYGCGYNGEAKLLEIMPDIVKIDMHIIRGIDRDQRRRSLVEGLIRFARSQGILVLAEGVETREEMETVVHLGIDLLQGFYLARPTFDAKPPEEAVLSEVRRAFQARRGTHRDIEN